MTSINKQATVASPSYAEGVGLHTGKAVKLELAPAPENTGLVFIRTDLPNNPQIKAELANVTETNRGTVLKSGEAEVKTVEHVLSALRGCGVDNAFIKLSGAEPPIIDGSAECFVELIKKSGLKHQNAEREVCALKYPFCFAEGGKSMCYEPSSRFEITFYLAYKNDIVPKTSLHVVVDNETYCSKIAKARTFGFEHEFEMLRANKLALGGSLENAVVINNKGEVVNEGGLRDKDELVLHKILDLIGDFALLKMPVLGHITAKYTGHGFNYKFAKMLKDRYAECKSRKDSKMLDINDIRAILPHRYPFLLVDRITALTEGESVEGYKNVTANESFFNGHFPEKPVMPGVLIIEAMAQVAGVIFLSKPEYKGKLPLFCGIDKVRFRKIVVPGDRLDFQVKVLKIRSNTCKVEGSARVEGGLVTSAELLFQLL